MLVNMTEMLQDAKQHHYAVASINTPNMMELRAVVEAAETRNCPIVINHAQTEEPLIPLEMIAPWMRYYAEHAKVPVAMHIDHGHDFDYIMRAVKAGFSSVMYDRSADPLEENIRKTNEMRKILKPLGITMECELGAMPNNMPVNLPGQEQSDLSDLSVYFTKVDEAKRFVEETDVEVLTVSFGTIHGIYNKKSNLDTERVAKIHELVKDNNTVLGMHGASGTEPDQIVKAIDAGIRMIHYYTGMDTCPTPALQAYIDAKEGKHVNFSQLAEIARQKMYENCLQTIDLFMSKRVD